MSIIELLQGPSSVSVDSVSVNGQKLLNIEYLLSTRNCLIGDIVKTKSLEELRGLVFAESLDEIKDIIQNISSHELFLLQIVEHNGCYFQYKERGLYPIYGNNSKENNEYSLEENDMNYGGGIFDPYKCIIEAKTIEVWEFYRISDRCDFNEILTLLNDCAQNKVESNALVNDPLVHSLAFRLAIVNQEDVVNWFWTQKTNEVIDYRFCYRQKNDL